jgi:hypothetical protein
VPLDGEMGKETLDLSGAERGGVPEAVRLLVKVDVLADPANVTLLRAVGVTFQAQSVADLFEEFHGGSFPCEFARTIFADRLTQPALYECFRSHQPVKALPCYRARRSVYCVSVRRARISDSFISSIVKRGNRQQKSSPEAKNES